MAINNIVVGGNLGPEFDIGVLTANQIRVLLDQIAYDNTASGLTATNPKAAIDELAVAVTGISHTSITGIDLRATANPNEYLVEISWTDEDGNAQTTTDPTPITISQATVVSADAGNLISDSTGALLTGATICAEITANCIEDCVIQDVFNNTLGTVQMLQ